VKKHIEFGVDGSGGKPPLYIIQKSGESGVRVISTSLCPLGVQGALALAGVLAISLAFEAGNPIVATCSQYWALASQNACARQPI
jgi:hypothetical protein